MPGYDEDDEEFMEIINGEINAAGDMDIWIQASKNLKFDDYTTELEDLKENGI